MEHSDKTFLRQTPFPSIVVHMSVPSDQYFFKCLPLESKTCTGMSAVIDREGTMSHNKNCTVLTDITDSNVQQCNHNVNILNMIRCHIFSFTFFVTFNDVFIIFSLNDHILVVTLDALIFPEDPLTSVIKPLKYWWLVVSRHCSINWEVKWSFSTTDRGVCRSSV